ncbi:glycerol-3-phosphate dehydrogenase [NAD(P)+] [Bartonella bacilliformis str. Heidi Mejia]|uniref:NAD(P)H-dependent glycerol-3-phosphate dehydrogenase n=1 Tax=Bartonella bacilliformis TaxID=774 RepID=UPI00044F21D9|nr:NAD(P)H-dependent glycerol-3-phosphate dehydrogenase [Bartonella bacilliformis]EYS91001.1 glycerol-3-phosphate dehydrogenase [NAD(P)+] [Bartonella bacilliformis str. Heidi Mejia]KEG15680.1 glycerol-3-phosphate dehydrogenase [NAD(P)+] [Bartonella bacilliformis Cond044]KEG17885.1 glycerol-3-phosphate dehydrogenase [NAD(P)+] [Bartonella bacilliformis Hosp800-02]KEG21806.1 glycerol-3-phosphate dehydrogenase [NAD(P)+] [Bartonella bacilliformis VAB9028]KEG23181.1 glycerol-3-phosphate dehydrogenas
MKITIFGGGAWGQALAFAFAQKNEVQIVSRRNISTALMPLNEILNKNSHRIILQSSLEESLNSELFVIAISVQALREWFIRARLNQNSKILIASKGIEEKTGIFVSQIAKKFISLENLCFLAGPSFAKEIILGLPCALAIHSCNPILAQKFANQMPSFIKPYIEDDIIGGEVASAYKNVIAIAGGICDGLNLGQNAKASLLSRGLVEMCKFGEYFGAKMQTFLGLSGAGDLFLTANSLLSRNYRVGLGLAQNNLLEDILRDLGEVAEGIKTSQAITQISEKEGIYTPIATEIQKIIQGKSPLESMSTLMKR